MRGPRWVSVAIAIVALMLAAATPGGAASKADFADPQGDGGGAPDILRVSVTNDAKGEIRFFVVVFGNIAPPSDASVTLVLDTDRNEDTGSGGFDYAFQFYAGTNQHAVGRWDGTQFAVFDAPTSAVEWTALSATFRINRSDLGGTGGFDFWVETTGGPPGSSVRDEAPNEGVWSYTLAAPQLSKITYPSALRPRVGKVLDARRARLQLSDGTTVAPESLTCRLTAGRTVVRPLPGGCRWRIAKALKGRTLTLAVVARYGGAELRATSRLKVR